MTGNDAMMVDNHQWPIGSYCCCQPVVSSGNRKTTMAATTAARVNTIPTQPTEAGGVEVLWDGLAVVEGPAMRAPPERRTQVSKDRLLKYRQNLTRQTVS